MMDIRRKLLMKTGGSAPKIEFGTFTLLSDEKTHVLNHNLGVVPDFCIIYPINVPTASTTYRIGYECITLVGQADYDISTNAVELVSPHVMAIGTGYNTTVIGSFAAAPEANYAGTATTNTIIVGGLSRTGAGGTLAQGTYGYILGKIPEQANN